MLGRPGLDLGSFAVPGTKALSLFLTAMLLSGCAGIAKGVTQAILERSEEQDTRACHVEGPPSVGLGRRLIKSKPYSQ